MIYRSIVRRMGLRNWRPLLCTHSYSIMTTNEATSYYLCKHLNINKNDAEYLCLKHAVVNKLSETRILSLVNALYNLGYGKQVLIEEPSIFGILPVTLKFRFKVLKECGFVNVTPKHLISYLPIVKQKTIGELRRTGEIPNSMNIENQLASYMTQWPTSLTTLISGDINDCTLYSLRLKIIQRYLELVLDLSKNEFYRGLQTYPTIKHRPLEVINETLTILQSQVTMPTHKIKANLYLVHVDPDNLKQIIFNFRSIGGIDIKEVLRMYPRLATKNYVALMEIRKILQEYQISNEAQVRCFEIYTLGPSTVRERLEKAKYIPEFQAYFNHTRFLKMIYYNSTAMKRLSSLYTNNKKCLSLNVLSGSSAHYKTFEKAPGDRLGKGKDLVFCITQCLGSTYSMSEVRNTIKKHPFWINVPLVQIKFVFQQLLSSQFTQNDIYQNCPILLYPWNKIKEILLAFDKKKPHAQVPFFQEQLNLTALSNMQKLSLVLYFLEKKHYFTGNGVWVEDKNKIVNVSNKEVSQNS